VADAAHAVQLKRMEQLATGRDGPAEVVAAIHRHCVRLAREEPDEARLLVRLDLTSDVGDLRLGSGAEPAIRRGATTGRFVVPDVRLVSCNLNSALTSVMQAVLADVVAHDADEQHAQAVLCLLGVPLVEAAEIARRPLS